MKIAFRHIKRSLIFIIGGTIVFFGVLMLVLPGPGIPVLIVGLAILATEFLWAERVLKLVRSWYDKVVARKTNQPKAISTTRK